MSQSDRSCADGFFNLRHQQESISCAFFSLIDDLQSHNELVAALPTMARDTLDSESRQYECFVLNFWRFSNRCPTVTGQAQRDREVKVNDGLISINRELAARDLPTRSGGQGLSVGAQVGIVIAVIVVVVAVPALYWAVQTGRIAWGRGGGAGAGGDDADAEAPVVGGDEEIDLT